MLNSFLQERFLMANLVKNANFEIEKAKGLNLKRDESLRKYEGDLEVYRGFIGKIRGSLTGQLSTELESVLGNIYRDIDSYGATRTEIITHLGDLAITDQRIQSLIREKDTEIFRLREKVMGIEKLRFGASNEAAHQKAMQVMQEETLKLRNEISALRSEKGSAELVTSYKNQINDLNGRIHDLEQDKSNLTSELLNLRNEYDVKLSIFNSQISIGKAGQSGITSPGGLNSPVHEYSSPSQGSYGEIRMVSSQIQQGQDGSASSSASQSRGATYGNTGSLAQSGISSASNQPSTSTYGVTQGQGASGYGTNSGVSGSGSTYGATGGLRATGIQGPSGTGLTSGTGVTSGISGSGSAYGSYGNTGVTGGLTSSTTGYQGTSPTYQSGTIGAGNLGQSGTSGSGYSSYQSGVKGAGNIGGSSSSSSFSSSTQGPTGGSSSYSSNYQSYNKKP